MIELKTQSGATVNINVAPFEDALTLNNLVTPYLATVGVVADANANIRMEDLMKVMVSAATDAGIQAQMMKCLARCTYNGQKITSATFEAAETRGDFYEVAMACVKENISPFVNGLFSQFSALLEAYQTKRADTPK